MSEFKLLALSELTESATNPRKFFDKAALEELAASVKEKGVLQPVLARRVNGHFELVAGARRYRAARMAGLKEIPAIVRDLTDDQALECQVIENLQRADVSAIEEARGYAELCKRGHKVEDLAKKISKSVRYIYARKLGSEIYDQLEALRLAGHKAVPISESHNSWQQSKQIVGPRRWKKQSAAKPCDYLAKGVFVDGPLRSRTIDICITTSCRKHFATHAVAGRKENAEEIKARRLAEAKSVIERNAKISANREILLGFIRKQKGPLTREELVELAKDLCYASVRGLLQELLPAFDKDKGKVEKLNDAELALALRVSIWHDAAGEFGQRLTAADLLIAARNAGVDGDAILQAHKENAAKQYQDQRNALKRDLAEARP